MSFDLRRLFDRARLFRSEKCLTSCLSGDYQQTVELVSVGHLETSDLLVG